MTCYWANRSRKPKSPEPNVVPFCVWVAANHLDDYRTAIVRTVRGGGDIDTNCAIVGGIVALAVGREGIPPEWLAEREELAI
ncbi:MAG: ADP-ribosylglycohydrolase family protein [Planctomycetes bacterium]|nr:ADP-ribosylglycohydrolase family protein [Planctomycetota bacterium]